jgi:hypothetical protein
MDRNLNANLRALTALAMCAALFGCGKPAAPTTSSSSGASAPAVDIGLKDGYTATIALDGLKNPSSVSFRASDGALTVCDSGNGRVLLVTDGKMQEFITGFATEHWKTDKETKETRFKLGPLSAVWVGDQLAVTDAGQKDGQETINFYSAAGSADKAIAKTNPVAKTTEDAIDAGEGNLCGMSLSIDGKTLYVGGQGADGKSWVLSCDTTDKKLAPLFSADDNGITTNSPMQTLAVMGGKVLVLYSGKGGADDGLIVEWNIESKKPERQWKLPGLFDPMGMALLTGSQDKLAVVDNNWALKEVKDGRLAIVELVDGAENAKIDIIATKLKGPVSCSFGPDKKLYVAQLGEKFDADKGSVLVIDGLAK